MPLGEVIVDVDVSFPFLYEIMEKSRSIEGVSVNTFGTDCFKIVNMRLFSNNETMSAIIGDVPFL